VKNKKKFAKGKSVSGGKSQKISTMLGTIILVIVAITVGTFVWKIEKNQQATEQLNNITKQQDKNQQTISGEKDNYGCSAASGYFWCDKTRSCVNNWNKSCGNIDIMNISTWDNFNSKDRDSSKFNFSFKYPYSWFNPSDMASDSYQGFSFYLKNDYTNICQEAINDSMRCNQTGRIALISVFSSTFILKTVAYDNEKKTPITVDNYKGFIIEGYVNDTNNGGYVANNGQSELQAIFPDIKGMRFQIVMKINNDSDRDIFNKIISTLKFNL